MYVEALEDATIDALGAFGVAAHGRVPGRTGVWVGDRKVAAAGVRITHGVSSHGVAVNVDTDLGWFDAIVPCGIADRSVTSLARELRRGEGVRHGGIGNAAAAPPSSSSSPAAPAVGLPLVAACFVRAFAAQLRYACVRPTGARELLPGGASSLPEGID